MQPSEPSPLIPTSCCPPQPVPAAHPPARLLIAPKMSSNTNTLLELLIFSPRSRVLFSCCQWGRWGKRVLDSGLCSHQGQPRVQSALPCWSPAPHCSLEGHDSTSPPGRAKAAGSNPGSRSEAGGKAEATCVVCHICKESMAQVSTTSTGGSPALPWIPFFVPGPSDTELQG